MRPRRWKERSELIAGNSGRPEAGRFAVSGSEARRRRPLSVNGAESSLSGRGMDAGLVLA